MSGVFYPNPRFQQQRPQPNSATVQRLLDENASLIQTIIEYQKRGSLAEVYDYEQVLHRNLVYLTQLADPTVNSQALPVPQPPPGPPGLSGQVGGTTPVRMPNVTLGQMPGSNPRPQQPSSTFASIDGTTRPQVQPPVGMAGSVMAQQPPQQQPLPQATTPQMTYRPAQAVPPQPPQAYGTQAPQYGGQPPQSYGQPPPQMVQMVRQPSQMQSAQMAATQMGQMGMAPQNPAMMRHPQQYGQPPPGSMYQQNPMQPNGPMGMPSMGGMPPGGPPQQMQVPPGYQQNFPNQ